MMRTPELEESANKIQFHQKKPTTSDFFFLTYVTTKTICKEKAKARLKRVLCTCTVTGNRNKINFKLPEDSASHHAISL